MNTENIKVSTKNINGKDRKIQVYCPTFKEWVEAIGEERLAARFNQGLIAHDLAGKLKTAYVESKSETTGKARVELQAQIEDKSTVFDLREFIAAERKEKDDKVAEAQVAAVAAVLEAMAEAMGISIEEAKVLFEAKKNK